jgi:hypothetical protein
VPRPAGLVEAAPDEEAGPEPVLTAHGGAFYLLGVLDHLDLPASAAGPGQPGDVLTRWGVLALALRAWPGAVPDDPLLAALDGLAWPDGVDPADPHPDHPWTFRPPAGSHRRDRSTVVRREEGEPGARRWGAQVAGLLADTLADLGVGPEVVHVPARVVIGSYSVRASFALDDIDIDVRRAGLDRDPGWVPALGRVVELRFT